MEVYPVPAKLRPGALGTASSSVAKQARGVSLIVSPRKKREPGQAKREVTKPDMYQMCGGPASLSTSIPINHSTNNVNYALPKVDYLCRSPSVTLRLKLMLQDRLKRQKRLLRPPYTLASLASGERIAACNSYRLRASQNL